MFFYSKIKLSKIWVWDPRSGIRKKPIPDPGSKRTGSRVKTHRIPEKIKKMLNYRGVKELSASSVGLGISGYMKNLV
jgi:hypothetical protein